MFRSGQEEEGESTLFLHDQCTTRLYSLSHMLLELEGGWEGLRGRRGLAG
jgi:hypothetical protein